MSELKAYFCIEAREIERKNFLCYTFTSATKPALAADMTEVYIKDEADKVIAELEMKLATVQQVLRLNKPEALYSNLETMSRLTHEKYVIERRERRQKYKRCLAMAKWCMTEYLHSKCLDFTNTEQWYWRRWHIRWRNLANKFKEAK